MKDRERKPLMCCPFCGSSDLSINHNYVSVTVEIVCRQCKCIGPRGNQFGVSNIEDAMASVIAAWNSRGKQ